MPLVAGVDCSTTATKVHVRDADDGRLLGCGSAPHPPSEPPCSEADPEAWWDALSRALWIATQGAGVKPNEIAAISVGAQQHGMVTVDSDGSVIRPAKLWNDSESAPQARELVHKLGKQAWAAACGSVPVASFTITKLAWLRRHEPRNFSRVSLLLLPHDWLTWRLCGRAATDRGDASGTGYWSPFEGRWRPDLLALVDQSLEVDYEHRLPEVLAPSEPAGEVVPSVVSHLGLKPGTVVGPGTGDNMGAALGVALDERDAAVSIGTSGTVYTVARTPVADASGSVAGFADATGRFLPLVCTLNATRVTDAFARLLGVGSESFDLLALSTPPGAGGLVLVPYLDGERTPDRPEARGVLAGLASDVSRAEVARAAVEGVVCGLLEGLDALVGAGVAWEGRRLVLLGGGSRSSSYRRVLADLAGLPVVVPMEPEPVAAGACVQAAAVLAGSDTGQVASVWAGGSSVEVVEPDLSVDARALRSRYARWRG